MLFLYLFVNVVVVQYILADKIQSLYNKLKLEQATCTESQLVHEIYCIHQHTVNCRSKFFLLYANIKFLKIKSF